ncbi:MAG: AAA family ATPase, partial [Methanobrevibacter sp.]|nr:AAA family ATPase [Methanobrevibacter sp.]
DDFKSALKEIQPSALREVLVQVPDIKWDDVGGLDDAKQELKEAVEWPLKYPDNFQKLGVKPPKGILLYGIPGTGKTLLAKAVASESEANFISIKGPELLSKWVGESEKGVREVFRKAKQTAPTVIFFDEIDSIASTRSGNDTDSGVTKRVVNQLLTEMDGLEELEDVAIIAATNRPDIIDPGLMRPGRFDRHIKVDTPSEEARIAIFEVHTKNMPLADDVDLKKLAKSTDGYVGADIEAVCREAAMLTLRNDIEASEIPNKYFKEAIEKVKPAENADEQLVQYM